MKLLVLRPGAEPEVKEVGEGERESYEFLKDAIGGWLEVVQLRIKGHNFSVYCDEEGLLKGLPDNFRCMPEGQVIVGPVVFTNVGPDGETQGLTDQEIENVLQWIKEMRSGGFMVPVEK